MSRRLVGAAVAVLASLAVAAPAQAGSSGLNAYRVKATAKNLEKLALAGFDVTEGRRGGKIEVFGTSKQMAALARKSKLRVRLVRDRRGRTSVQRSRSKVLKGLAELGLKARASAAEPLADASDAAYKVWRKFDAVPNDGHEQYTELYDRIVGAHPNIAAKVKIGESLLGRDITAIQVTRNAQGVDNGKPAVLYNALQHAREWLAGETCKRTLDYFTSLYGQDKQVTRLVNERQLWFVCVSNPDGYEFTFTPGGRLWRKNLRELNGQPGIQSGDGVDPNRNFPADWGLDDEGSSPQHDSETYRGAGPASEPETQAMLHLWDMVDFAFQKNDHTAAALLLYPQGWQQYTPAADDPIFTALAGDDEHSAIETFDPDLGAELYITNGDTLDTAYNKKDILAYTPEGTAAKDPAVSVFEFEDNEGAIANEFRRHLDFSLDLAESADDPANPDSHLDNTVQDFYVDAFPYSYGDHQQVQALVKRELGDVVMSYSVNGGPAQSVATSEWSDGERYYQEAGVYYHRLRGEVPATNLGDRVQVWFEQAAGQHRRSPAFTYEVMADSGARVLLLAAEDYTGPTPGDADGQPNYLNGYKQALSANGFTPDVYDVDAMGRKAPHPLGVLSHYDAVVWYTGDDYLTREPGQVPGTGTSRLALDEVVAIRDYLNEGGKVVFAGKHAGQQYFEGYEFRNAGFPQPNEDKHGAWCDATQPEARDGCIPHTDDFFQYYLGSYLRVEDGGSWNDATGEVRPVVGTSPFSGTWTPAAQAGDPGAGAPTSTLASTSSLLHTAAYDDFSEVIGSWAREESGPFSPHTGSRYLYSGATDQAYKRLSSEIDVPASGGSLTFFTSFDTEPDWDYFFVEAAPHGTENWTTLPDRNGHTSQGTGESCPEGWAELHARLVHYQTESRDTCSPTGTTGTWNAATGSSSGWQEWSIDLTPYAGQTIDLALVYATDWGTLNLGVWLDDITVDAGADSSFTGFEGTDLGAWQLGPPLAGSPSQAQWNAEPSTQTFQEGAVLGTKEMKFVDGPNFTTDFVTSETRKSVYAGFELGTLPDADRISFFEEVLEYFALKPPDAE
jgi:hypothetical protein